MNTLTTGDVVTRVKRIVGSKVGLNENEVNDEAHLHDDLGLDSLDFVEIIMEIEREFEISITDDCAMYCVRIDLLVRAVEAELSGEIGNPVRFTDYWGQELRIGDEITYVGARGHTPYFQDGKIVDFDENRKYSDCIQVLGKNNARAGWTYANRIIKKIQIV